MLWTWTRHPSPSHFTRTAHGHREGRAQSTSLDPPLTRKGQCWQQLAQWVARCCLRSLFSRGHKMAELHRRNCWHFQKWDYMQHKKGMDGWMYDVAVVRKVSCALEKYSSRWPDTTPNLGLFLCPNDGTDCWKNTRPWHRGPTNPWRVHVLMSTDWFQHQ